MPRDVRAELGLSRIINASGTETVTGASAVPEEIIEAMVSILPEWVEIAELQDAASRIIAEATGAEAGMVTGCSAAGIVIATAATMTGTDLAAARRLPETSRLKKRRVLMMMGHECDFGATVSQMVRLTGAELTLVGTATSCSTFELEAELGEDVAAVLYVASHHTVQSGLIELKALAEISHGRDVPVIVDGAAEYGWRGFIEAGADVIVLSAQKAPAGPTAGIIAGRPDIIRACRLQERAIGRPMKAGKEAIMGAIAALERWQGLDHAAARAVTREKLEHAAGLLVDIEGLWTELEPDPTGNPFERLAIHVDADRAGMSAGDLGAALASDEPKILLRRLHTDRGVLLMDARRLDKPSIAHICRRIRTHLGVPEAPTETAPDTASDPLATLKRWQSSLSS